MRMLERNKSLFYYAKFLGLEKVLDENGKFIGDYKKTYSEPVRRYANIPPARGEATVKMFGLDVNYDKVLVAKDIHLDEESVLWVDNLDIEKPHDYIVKKVARSMNSMQVAIQKVNVREQND